jgi:hypothetical protein
MKTSDMNISEGKEDSLLDRKFENLFETKEIKQQIVILKEVSPR